MNFRRHIYFFSALILTFCLHHEVGWGQAPDTIRTGVTTEGKEFWVVFQKNFRDYETDDASKKLTPSQPLELELFITSSKRSRGYVEVAGIGFRRDFVVEAGQVISIPVDSAAQLRSSEEIENLAVHIVSDQAIAVYGLSHRYQTTDTYLAYPVDVLGTKYRAMGYKWLADDLLSQFAVIGTEDNTEVTITPSNRTKKGKPANRPFTITLDRGEVYQVIPEFRATNRSDLTGSTIESDKPVAVFSGHNCAYVPDNSYKACNILVEQMPPIRSWGRQFFVGTLAGRSSSVIRVLAHEDGTEVFENNSRVATLAAGQYYENANLKVNTMLTSSKPILVAQFSKGYTAIDPLTRRADSVGDPMMIVVAPTEQFLSSYRFSTPVTGNWEHYINLIVPTDAVRTIRLDNEPINPDRFAVFGISRYSIAQIKLPYGTYSIEAAKPFGLYSYGFGYADKVYDAYGNGGGQSMLQVEEIPDRIPPMISAENDHFTRGISGVVRDDRLNDSGVETVSVVEFDNLKVEIDDFESGAPQVTLRFRTVVDRQDAYARLRLADRAGNVADRVVCVQYDEFGDSLVITVPPAGEFCTFQPPIYLGGDFRYTVLDNHLTIPPGDDHIGSPVELNGSVGMPQYGIGVGGTFPWSPSLKLSGRIGLEFWSLDAYGYWPDSVDHRADDGTILIEEFLLERDITWLTLTPGARYYPLNPQSYLFGNLGIMIPLGTNERFTRTILNPSSYVYDNGTNSLVVYDGDGPGGFPVTLAPEMGIGAEISLPSGLTVVGELGGGFALTSLSPDRSWGATWLFARFGLMQRFSF